MNQQQLIEQKAKELLIQNCGTPTIGDNGEMTADLDYYIESDAALSTMIEFAEWMHGEGERQWISVKDRLPENDGVYYCICEDEPALMMITDGKIRQVRFCNGGVYIADYVPKDYTYWTPKPQSHV